MSTDNQRAAERLRAVVDVWGQRLPEQIRVRPADVAELLAEVDRLRAELEGVRAEWAETRSADVDVIVELRAELAETRAVGDTLAGAAIEALSLMEHAIHASSPREEHLRDSVAAWRSLRGNQPI